MAYRTLWTALLCGSLFASGAPRLAAGQAQPPAQEKGETRKAAEHATANETGLPHPTGAPANDRQIIWPGMNQAGVVVLPSGWSLKPAGRQSSLGDLPVQVAVHPTEPILAVLHAGYGEHEIVTIRQTNGRVIGRVSLPGSFAGLVWSSDGSRLFAGGGFDDCIYRFDHAGGLLSGQRVLKLPRRPNSAPPRESGSGARLTTNQSVPAGLALTKDGKTLYVAAAFGHFVARFDADTGEFRDEIALETDCYPYGLVLDEARQRLYVSLWSKAKVAIVDLATMKVAGSWPTEEHPNEMLPARGGRILYVANANRNSVTVIDVEQGKPIETINTAIDPRAPAGCTPSALALTPDESMLFVANANTNDLAVVDVKEAGASAPLGFIPTGWYPTSVRLSRDGKKIFVANGKGATSRANRDGPVPMAPAGTLSTTREYIGGLFQGTLSIILMPTPRQMALYSQTVYECSPLKRGDPAGVRAPYRQQGTPFPPRSAIRRQFATWCTSSKRTGLTIRSLATCGKATARRSFACSLKPSLPTTTPWPVSSCCSTTFTSTAR